MSLNYVKHEYLKYKDIAEFGNSMHHKFQKLTDNLYKCEHWGSYAREYTTMHHSKREIQPFFDYDNRGVTDRDKMVFKLAIAMVQQVMSFSYHKHCACVLQEHDIWPVNAPKEY